MFALFAFLLLFGFLLGATLVFQRLVGSRIAHEAVRLVAVGLFFVVALAVSTWGALALVVGAALSPTTHPVNDTCYFTQQEYGFVTTSSSGYDLTFYQQRPFWLDQELGRVQLECAGQERVKATIQLVNGERIRLRVEADSQMRLDTVLGITPPFHFRRTFEDRSIDFSRLQ